MLALVVLTAALSGCFGGKNPDARCNDVAEYQRSGSVPDVVTPDGLAAPNRDSGYLVPPAAAGLAEAALQARGAACLERPPDYFRKEPAAAPATPPAPAAAPPAVPAPAAAPAAAQ